MFATRQLALGVLAGLALSLTEAVEVVELVAEHGRVAGEIGEERAASLDGELGDTLMTRGKVKVITLNGVSSEDVANRSAVVERRESNRRGATC